MNKDVQNYLSDNENNKTNKILQFIARNKESLKKAVALGVSTATLITMLNSCDSATIFNNDDVNTEAYEEFLRGQDLIVTDAEGNEIKPEEGKPMFPLRQEERSEEEIAQTGITANDVLASFNNICYDYFHEYFDEYKEEFGEDYNTMSCEFLSIGGRYYNISTADNIDTAEKAPFLLFDEFGLIDGTTEIYDFYHLSITFRYNIGNSVKEFRRNQVRVPSFVIDKLMAAYGIEQQYVTNELRDSFDFTPLPPRRSNIYLVNDLLNKDSINNATQEQLEALYDVAYSIYFAIENLRLPTPEDLPFYQKNLDSNNME